MPTLIDLLQALVCVSEKAACIARICRAEKELFELLVEEKHGDQKNRRFVQDFKTLADVLVQETVKHDLSHEFPELSHNITGEESSCFTNTLGETITVEIKSNQDDTAALLARVLDGNQTAASLLASTVHQDVHTERIHCSMADIEIPIHTIGIWIDPIDATSEYVHGKYQSNDGESIAPGGLQCVCILIGVYDLSTGIPVLGVVNQPFWHQDPTDQSWLGKCHWGISYMDCKTSSMQERPNGLDADKTNTIVVMSSSEPDALKTILQEQYQVVFTAGAGYKLLCVALGLADLYVLSQGSTFRWDTCAPHALLRSLDGGVVPYTLAFNDGDLQRQSESHQIVYNRSENDDTGIDSWCNRHGIVAYRNEETLGELLQFLHDHAS